MRGDDVSSQPGLLETGRPVTPVGVLARRLHGVRRRLDSGHVDATVLAELDAAVELAAGLEPYLALCTSAESPALRGLAAKTRSHDWSGHDGVSAAFVEREMLSGHVEGQLLKTLVRLSGARRVLDIGMFTGYSALAMAEALGDDGEVVACELDADVAAFAQECFDQSADGHKISVQVGPALDTLDRLSRAGESFDLVFLDADKAGYVDYFVTLMANGLLAPRGVICVDNTLMQGEPYIGGDQSPNGVAITRFNLAVAADSRVEQVLVPLRDGITLIVRTSEETA